MFWFRQASSTSEGSGVVSLKTKKQLNANRNNISFRAMPRMAACAA